MNKDHLVYLILILLGILFAILALFVMMTNPDYFSTLFAAYMLGYSIYMTVALFRARKAQEDKPLDVSIWVTLFTVFLSILLASMTVVMIIQRKRSQGAPSMIMYQPVAAANPYGHKSL